MTTAELSKVLFAPTTFLLYVGAMLAYFWTMAQRIDRAPAVEGQGAAGSVHVPGRRGLWLATGLASLGLAAHLGHLVTRSMASGGRVPWGNMFEYSSVMGFGVVLAGLVIFQWRMRRPEVVGFLLLGAILTMGGALLVWSEPGPLMPILNSEWLKIHVFAIMLAATIFTVGFVFNGLYLLRETAERRVAESNQARAVGSTVGAAYSPAGTLDEDADRDSSADAVPERTTLPDAVEGVDLRGGVSDPTEELDEGAYGRALKAAIDPRRLFAGTWLATAGLSWVFWAAEGWHRESWSGLGEFVTLVNWEGFARFFTVNTVLGVAAVIAWVLLARLPAATTLDSLAYRTIAFGFPIWTFAVISGAIWAEQSWGRYWGWDPKETSAFLTWLAYAAYLHARATRGLRGRGAAKLGILAFAVLMFTYFVVNLVVTGLHSYAGL
ncbi:MAG TPA: c-type cytochrome biogenesis protein CcsB [Nitriliruptorales bacterium]